MICFKVTLFLDVFLTFFTRNFHDIGYLNNIVWLYLINMAFDKTAWIFPRFIINYNSFPANWVGYISSRAHNGGTALIYPSSQIHTHVYPTVNRFINATYACFWSKLDRINMMTFNDINLVVNMIQIDLIKGTTGLSTHRKKQRIIK